MTEGKVLTSSEVLALGENGINGDERPSTAVVRPLDQENDLGNLLGSEVNEFQLSEESIEDELKARARDNCQLLLNELWTLPTERNQEAIVAILPPPTSLLPREKPVPVPKPPTKWEQYAKEKGIVKKKKSRLVWDDAVREWIPRFGYKKAVAETEKNWIMEYKEGENQDPREKMIEEKREKVAKNELQRLRNIARGKKTKVPGVGLAPMNPTESQTSADIQKASHLAKKSTASLGKFQDKLPSALEKKVKPTQGKKRKFDPLVNTDEKARSLKVLEQLHSKKEKIDVTKAVGRKIYSDDNEQSEDKKNRQGKKGGKGGRGKKQQTKSGKFSGSTKTGTLKGGRSSDKRGGDRVGGKGGAKKGQGGKAKQGGGSGVKK